MASMQAFSSASRVAHRRSASTRAQARGGAVRVCAEKVLIVNTKKGGHSFVGLYLAKELLSKGHTVTIFNDGDKSLEAKAPFSQYAALDATIAYGSPTDPSTYPAGDFDAVYDNNGKSMDECKALIDTYASKVANYVFVGSAGAYKASSVEPMHVAGDERKASASHVAVENYLAEVGAPYTVFHPLYMYGAHTAKDCEQWFMDRIVRDRPVPIPTPGIQLTSVSNVEDVAAMMAAAVGNKACVGQHYNSCSDRTVSLEGIAHLIAKEMGKEANIVLYDEKDFDIPKGKGFPFRSVHFFASTDKAKHDLGWTPKHTFTGDVADRVAEYMASGRADKDMEFPVDDMIVA